MDQSPTYSVLPEAASPSGLQRGASQMVGLCLPDLPHPDGDESSGSVRALVQSLQTDVASLRTNQAKLCSRISSVEDSLEMRTLNFVTHSDELGNPYNHLVETSIDDEHPRLLIKAPVQEVANHRHDQMVGQCATLSPPNASNTCIEQRVEQLECSTSSHDQAIKQNAQCIRRLELTYNVCMQRMDSLPVNKPRSKSL